MLFNPIDERENEWITFSAMIKHIKITIEFGAE